MHSFLALPSPSPAPPPPMQALGGDPEPLYRASLQLDPASPKAVQSVAEALEARGELQAALEMLQAGTAAAPQAAEGYNNLGVFLQQQGHNAAAVAMLRIAAQLRPDDATNQDNTGVALVGLGDPSVLPQARQHFARAQELDPLMGPGPFTVFAPSDAAFKALKAVPTDPKGEIMLRLLYYIEY